MLVGLTGALGGSALAQTDHFHPKGKPPSDHTLQIIKQARATFPFADTKDFEKQKKGFIAAPESWTIMAKAGNVAWDMERYKFLLEGKDFDSIHPSLERQSMLNMNFGLYQVMDGVYQVRGFDLANISFVKGDTGWIVFDPLTSEETARAAGAGGGRLAANQANNVYADRNGNVYRRQNDGAWQQRQQGQWRDTERGQAAQAAGQQARAEGGGTRVQAVQQNRAAGTNRSLNRDSAARQRGNARTQNFNRGGGRRRR